MNSSHEQTQSEKGDVQITPERRSLKSCHRNVKTDAGWRDPFLSRLYLTWEAVEDQISSRPLLVNLRR